MATKNMFSDIFWWTVQERTLEMGAHSARKGFGVPLLRDFVKGRMTGGWGAIEGEGYSLLANRNKLKALGIFEKAGLSGFREAEATAAWRFGQKTAAGIGKRYLIGRAAGIGLAAFNLAWQFPLVIGGAQLVYGGLANQVNQHTYANLGGYFPESQGAYSSRQRTMQAITASHLQARSAIGNEAMLMHR